MLILLPPSETKSQPATGPNLDLTGLTLPSLGPTRRKVLSALVRMCTGDPGKARAALQISVRQEHEVHRNSALRRAACAPASEVYTGVLFDAVDLPSLRGSARKRAVERVLIASALFGLVRITDAIPAYRLSGDCTLPTIGRLSEVWRAPITAALAEAAPAGVVLDLRSSTYAALGSIPEHMTTSTVVGRVVRDAGGRTIAVSHHNKATKGRLARALLTAGGSARTPQALAALCSSIGFRVDLHEPERAGRPWTMDVLVDEL